ncbi:AAA family ATPase [Pseudomonas aeruginosa]|uniref:AAA family ATPase n=1 Tax=Pseudomonas aeruginosa TaxID=287 RepID=UPI001CF0853A|nr:AAA family ATPase [Pseudomonas aeruginosa]
MIRRLPVGYGQYQSIIAMRITEIALTNFRSFQVTQSIALAPVTLLFGPNSVGKSSVLMALFYIQQMLEKGQCDPPMSST